MFPQGVAAGGQHVDVPYPEPGVGMRRRGAFGDERSAGAFALATLAILSRNQRAWLWQFVAMSVLVLA